MTLFNLNILPIHRNNGQELAEIPGLLALTPPRKTARGRERDSFILYLMLSGNTTFSHAEFRQLTGDAAGLFYQTPGPLTSAIRKAADQINARLLERNRTTTGRGQYALGLLVLAAIRENQCTLLLSGPTHVVWVSEGQSRHIHEPALSGKGLGSSQSLSAYFSKIELHPQDLLVLSGVFPRDWEADLLNERPPTSLEASYRKLVLTKGDLNAVLIQAQSGHGLITNLRPEIKPAHSLASPKMPASALPQNADTDPRAEPASSPETPSASQPGPVLAPPVALEEAVMPQEMEFHDHGEPEGSQPGSSSLEQKEVESAPEVQVPISEEKLDALAEFGAHIIQPSAYAIPPQHENTSSPPREEKQAVASGVRGFPSSIPRAKPAEQNVPIEEPAVEAASPETPLEPSPPPGRARQRRLRFKTNSTATRQVAKAMVGGLQTGRRVNERFGSFLHRFLPRLLPGADARQPFAVPTYVLILIAVFIPAIVVTVASLVYFRYGQSIQYDELFAQATTAEKQAMSETDPTRQRDEWQRVLAYLNDADKYRDTEESKALRTQAQTSLDSLMGVLRLEFVPAFSNSLGNSTQINRMAASESDLYMLDAESGRILHASFSGKSLQLDNSFDCKPGSYGGYQVDALVDLIALPKANAVNATVMGVDANGNLLYCAPNQVPQAIPLPAPPTNWGRIAAIALDSGNLYALDPQGRAVWVFVGKDSTFTDEPYYYFGNEIPANIENAIDLAAIGDDIYMLHSDGHLSTCTFSRLSDAPTRCQDPAILIDDFAAHSDMGVFQLAHFTQMSITSPPNSVLLVLDAENKSVFRFSPRSFELQNQVTGYAGNASPFKRGSVTAMAVSPNYVLYLAISDQVYFATNMP